MEYSLPNLSSSLRPRLFGLATTTLLLLTLVSPLRADDRDEHRGKQPPNVPTNLVVSAGNKVSWHVYAVGVQIYTWQNISTNETPQLAWVFKAPEAVLFDREGEPIGLHYAGPTWENENGKVIGSVLQRANSPDPNAIPWLLLQAVDHDGHGVLSHVTYIQRVNTEGGKAPLTGPDASHIGDQLRVAYTAEYYFYKGMH